MLHPVTRSVQCEPYLPRDATKDEKEASVDPDADVVHGQLADPHGRVDPDVTHDGVH